MRRKGTEVQGKRWIMKSERRCCREIPAMSFNAKWVIREIENYKKYKE